MAPLAACQAIGRRHPDALRYDVTLYGSLALTGIGHRTDYVIKSLWGDKVQVHLDATAKVPHPNTMDVAVTLPDGVKVYRVYSIGGGAWEIEGEARYAPAEIYPQPDFAAVTDICHRNRWRLIDYVAHYEPQVIDYLRTVWHQMVATTQQGLQMDGELPGGLHVVRKARTLYNQRDDNEDTEMRFNRLTCSYALAVAEQNAAGETVVTAPTCGACGVVPAVLYYMQTQHGYSEDQIIAALAAAGVIGNVIKTNASISGAECGCQAEIGSACSMAAAALAELYQCTPEQIDCAAEIAMEHHLGLTCDPQLGLVQIPCIERNAVAAMRAFNAVGLARSLFSVGKIHFDGVVATMYQTGKDLASPYRETATGGLAKLSAK